jgi:hypothetical protein
MRAGTLPPNLPDDGDATAVRRTDAGRRRRSATFVAAACVALVGLVFSGQAVAKPILKFKEDFGGIAQPAFGHAEGMAVDDSSGDLLVLDAGDASAEPPIPPNISRFKPSGEPDDFPALGTNVISESSEGPLSFASATEAQIAVDNSGGPTDGDIYVTKNTPNVIEIFARTGEYLGQLSEAGGAPFFEACGVTAGINGNVYVGDYEGNLSKKIQKFAPTTNPVTNADFVSAFTEPFDPCALAEGAGPTANAIFALNYEGQLFKLNAATGAVAYPVSEGKGTTTTVDPTTGNVLVAIGNEVDEYDASGASAPVKVRRLTVGSAVQGIAVSLSGDIYVSRQGSKSLEVWEGVLAPTVSTSPASSIMPAGATLNGEVNPEGEPLVECKFEFGPAGTGRFDSVVPCNDPSAGEIPGDSVDHSVHADISGLQQNTVYNFRLTAANASGAETSQAATVRTTGAPVVNEIRALEAAQTSATLEAHIDPRGFATSYIVEWGPSTSYGNTAISGSITAGSGPTQVSAEISGLTSATTYHYRVVAESGEGRVTVSADQEVETLDSCGLPTGRCLELVSPAEPGPAAQPGLTSNEELDFQASPEPDSIIYSVANGLTDTTKGAEVLYRATRGASGWSSTQFSPAITTLNQTVGPASRTAATQGISSPLSCAFLASNQPLTSDPGTRLVVESGGANYYRRNPDGSYTAITSLPPENPEILQTPGFGEGLETYVLEGFSESCDTAVFTSLYSYPGVPAVSNGGQYLYEWKQGALRSVGEVPAPGGGEVGVVATVGGPGTNTVSADGSRVFFMAAREAGGNPTEIGKQALFVREDGVTRDISESTTGTADSGAKFEYATPDGAHAYFIANAGLTSAASSEGEDLYEYNLGSTELTDLTVGSESGGAAVASVIGASQDGSRVYFAARGQLISGKGRTFAENVAAGSYSLYESDEGTISYIGVFDASDIQGKQFDRVSPDGRYLLFQSREDETGYESGGANEAYLFDAEAQGEPLMCVSCRQDGQPSVTPHVNAPLGSSSQNAFHPKAWLVEIDGQARVVFSSQDRLATGAVAENTNLYEWAHEQVMLIATEPPNLQGPELGQHVDEYVQFAGASAEGTDLYFATPARLTPESNGRWALFDARSGGGLSQQVTVPAPCDAIAEGGCRGSESSTPPTGGSASKSFTGPSNPKAKSCKKGLSRVKAKCVKKQAHGKRRDKSKKKKAKSKQHGNKSEQHEHHGKHASSHHARQSNAKGGAGQ